jgi:hypothetical protein
MIWNFKKNLLQYTHQYFRKITLSSVNSFLNIAKVILRPAAAAHVDTILQYIL